MVRRVSQQSRRKASRSIALAAVMLLFPGSALALDPSLDVSQYAHTAWKLRDGFLAGRIFAFAQTPDGYLWFGTEFGLVRFDGVRTVPFELGGEQLPSSFIHSLLVSRDGTLWIGTGKGLASWKDGRLRHYQDVGGRDINPLLQDRDGTIWFGARSEKGPLCRIVEGKISCEGAPAMGSYVVAFREDRRGNLWVLTSSSGKDTASLWRWRPGPPQQYAVPPLTDSLGEDDDGALLLGDNDAVKRLEDGRLVGRPVEGRSPLSRPARFFRSSDGSLWIGTFDGLVHLHQGRSDVFKVGHGLSGEVVFAIYEDHEGSVWVSTSGGLDRFRDYTFPRITADQGLSSSVVWAVAATPDGSVWMATSTGLNQWKDGRVTLRGRASAGSSPRSMLGARALGLGVDDEGRLWAPTRGAMFVLERGEFSRVPGLEPKNTFRIVADGRGGMWIAAVDGLFHWTHADVSLVPWNRLGPNPSEAPSLLSEQARNGLWVGSLHGGVKYVEDGRVLASYAAADGLGTGRVTHLRSDETGSVWASTEGGLSRIQDGRVATLTAKSGLPCDAVHWSIEDPLRFVWLYTRCGLVRLARAELEAWVVDPKRKVQPTLFDVSDGVATVALTQSYGPSVTRTPDGKIWFTAVEGVTVIDPGHLRRNDQPPPVHIETIVADGKSYDPAPVGSAPLRLPSRIRDLEIDYTALSLRAPEKVRFRVKLEGQDRDWRELLNERHAHYTNLPPRSYRFLVKAANDSGVWNEEGATLAFTIPPAFHETVWFRALCVAAVASLLWGAYLVRMRALDRRRRLLERHEAEITALNERLMKAQEEERSRIAGELHDGVLQQLTTVTLDLGTLKYQVPPGSTAKDGILVVQNKLMALGGDIRQLSHELHPAVLQESGLPEALSMYCREFSKTRGIAASCEADPELRNLSPGSALALYRIAQEALGNAAKHARASHVRLRLERAGAMVRLSVSDDGIGFIPGDAGASGGLGLVNMRERVRQLKGGMGIESQPGRGTTVQAEVPLRSV